MNQGKEEKKLPKPVFFWLVCFGFLLGNAIGGIVLLFNVLLWACINLFSILAFIILGLIFGKTLEAYAIEIRIPRFKIKEKKDET